MKRVLAMLFGATMLFVAFGATTGSAAPGPNENNEHGLCTAYFNGKKKGHETGDGPGPFGVLEDTSDDGNEDEDMTAEQQIYSDVFERCQGLIGGNPEHNGRFDCSDDPDDKKAGTPRDTDNSDGGDPGDGEFECYLQGQEP